MMRQRSAMGSTAAVAIFVAVVIVGVASVASLSTLDQSQTASCSQPAYLVRLASQVEQTQSFVQASRGLSYVLAFGNNETGSGTANGIPVVYPPLTLLTFYSYGGAPTQGCSSSLETSGVVGALWVQVPVENGAYNLTQMSVYFTPGVLTNDTALTTIDSGTTSLVGYCNSTQGNGLLVKVLSDAGQPVQGAQVAGVMVGLTSGGSCSSTTGTYITNSTGSVFIPLGIGNYYRVSMSYQGVVYATRAPIEPMSTTYVTFDVPSGNVTVSTVANSS